MAQEKVEFENLTAGYEFAPTGFRLDNEMVTAYINAVESDKRIYEEHGIVPPMAIAALSMAAMSELITLPPGAIHVSQELQFLDTVSIDENLTSQAKVNRKVERGNIRMLTIGIDVLNQQKATVMTGETSFILPTATMEAK